MRVLFLIPDHDYGGEEKRSLAIFKYLSSKEGIQCWFMSSETAHTFLNSEFIPNKTLNSKLLFVTSIFSILNCIDKHQIDTVLCFKRKTALLGNLIEKLRPNVRVIFNVANKWRNHNYFWSFTPKELTTLSEKLIPKRVLKTKKIKIIPLGIHIPNEKHAIESQEPDKDNITLINAGKLNWQKNHIFLLELAHHAKKQIGINIRVVIAGTGSQRIKLESLSKKLEIELKLEGEVKDMASFYRNGDFYVQCSNQEGLPNALLEAGLLRIPILANDVGATSDLINDETGWLIGELSIDQYTTALKDSLDNYRLTTNKTHALEKKIRKDFTDTKMLESYYKLVKKG